MLFTLVSDGSSDRALLPIIEWLLRRLGVTSDLEGRWADLRRLRNPPANLPQRISASLELYPCDVLFVHRDSEGQEFDLRVAEIDRAIETLQERGVNTAHICVIPIRMLEAWLLIDIPAIRSAAGNPNGTVCLALPRVQDLETIPDPKDVLFDMLRTAAQLNARRLRKFSVSHARLRVTELIGDFSPLLAVPAFARLQEDVLQVLQEHHWL